jgi:hypothetical protein
MNLESQRLFVAPRNFNHGAIGDNFSDPQVVIVSFVVGGLCLSLFLFFLSPALRVIGPIFIFVVVGRRFLRMPRRKMQLQLVQRNSRDVTRPEKNIGVAALHRHPLRCGQWLVVRKVRAHQHYALRDAAGVGEICGMKIGEMNRRGETFLQRLRDKLSREV